MPSRIWIRAQTETNPVDGVSPHIYGVAGQTLVAPPDIEALAHLRLPGDVPGERGDQRATAFECSAETTRARGWVAGAERWVSSVAVDGHFAVDVEGIGTFTVGRSHEPSDQVIDVPTLRGPVTEALLGPPLMLALASRSVWGLHASAVTVAERVVVFLGTSGSGKSTPAAYLDERAGMNRICDDIVPVSWHGGALVCSPHFPQPRLAAEEQVSLDSPKRLHVSAICLIDSLACSGEPTACDVAVTRLSSSDAARALIRHGVATRLFDRTLLGRHFAFCVRAAAGTPLYALGYPRTRDALPLVASAIRRLP